LLLPSRAKLKINTNLKYQFIGQGAAKFLALLFFIFLARKVGEEGFGKFNFALVTCFLFGQPLALAGQDLLLSKWVSRGQTGALRTSFKLWVISGVLAALLVIGVSFFIKVHRLTLYILLGYTIIEALEMILFSYLRGLEKMKTESITLPLQKAAVLGLLFLLPVLGIKGPEVGAIAMFLPAVITTIVLTVILRSMIMQSFADAEKGVEFGRYAKESASLVAVAFLWMVYFRVDSFMLGVMKGDHEVGIYNAAYRLVEGVFILPGIVMIVYFPRLAKKVEFRKNFLRLLGALSGMGLACAILLFLLASLIIRLLYAGGFVESGTVLRLLSAALFFVFCGHLTTQSLVAMDKNKTYLLISGGGAIINIVLNYIFIPTYGAQGAAGVTVLTEALVTLVSGAIAWKTSASL